MAWPITKKVSVDGKEVLTFSNKIILRDHSVVIQVTATLQDVVYSECWTLPKENHQYSQPQAQKDFDSHIQKVAEAAAGRFVAHDVTEALT